MNRITWNHTTECELFVLDRNTSYNISLCKKKTQKNQKISLESTAQKILILMQSDLYSLSYRRKITLDGLTVFLNQ